MNNAEWNLKDIYKTEDDIQKDWNLIENAIEKLKTFEGKLNTETAILEYLTIRDEMEIRLNKIYLIRALKHDEDVLDEKANEELNAINDLMSRSDEAQSFFETELQEKVSQELLEKMIKNDPKLEIYRLELETTIEPCEHELPDESEEVIKEFSSIFNLLPKLYTTLVDGELKFKDAYDSENKKHQVTLFSFIRLLKSSDRKLRKECFESLYKEYINHAHTISKIYISLIKKNEIISKLRNYSSFFERKMYLKDSSVEVYNSLIEAVNDNLEINHRYYQLKKKMLGLEKMYQYDKSAPLMGKIADVDYSYEQAKEIVLNALKPLGKEYINTLKEAFESNWAYVYPKENTNHIAFARAKYGVHPYILLNFKGILYSVYTVAHEFGHAIHFYYSNIFQEYPNSGWSLIVSEVAANANEALLSNYLIENEQCTVKKIIYLQEEIEKFSNSIIRQTMLAEFERDIHEAVNKGETFTCEQLCTYYGSLVKRYFGDAIEDSVEIQYEWARISHLFKQPFYVFQYALGRASAVAIVEKILERGESCAKEYVDMLKKGNSMPPLEQLKSIGVDLTTDEPIKKAFKYYERKINELEKLMNEISINN